MTVHTPPLDKSKAIIPKQSRQKKKYAVTNTDNYGANAELFIHSSIFIERKFKKKSATLYLSLTSKYCTNKYGCKLLFLIIK